MRVSVTPVSTVILFALVAAVSAVSGGRGGARPPLPFVLSSRKMASVFDYAPLLDHRTTSPGLVEASSNQPFAAPSSSWTTSSHSVPADSDVDFRLAILFLHARIDQQTKSSLESYMYLLSKTHHPTSFDSSASPSSFRFTTAAAAAANVDAKIDDEEDNGIIEASSIGGDTKKSPCDFLDECGLAARTTGDGVLAIVYDGMGTPEPKKGDSQITNIAGPRPLELAAYLSIQLLAKTIYLAGPLAHIQSKAKVVPTIISQNVARIVHTKNTIKMNKISDDEGDIMIDDDAGLEEDLHGDGLISDSKDSTQIAQQDHDHADDIDTVTPPFVGVGGNSLTDRVTSHHLSPIAESIALVEQPSGSSSDSTSIGGGGGRSFDAFISADRSALQSRQHGVHDDSSSSASSLGDNGSTESSFNVVGITSPTTTHHEMNGILDRLAFRPKSLAAQKRGLGEYKTAAISSMTAASARLRVLPVQHSSTLPSSKYDIGLSSATGARFESTSDDLEQDMDRRSTSLDHLSGVDLMTSLIDMDFICLYCPGRIGQAYHLLEQLASSRHLLRPGLNSALFVSFRHEIALEHAQDTGMAKTGGSIVLADDENGLVVTIQLHGGRFHVKYWRKNKTGRNDMPEGGPCRAIVDKGEASVERTLFSNQDGSVSYPSLCQGQGAFNEGISVHSWALFFLGICLIALRFGLRFALSSENVVWRYSGVVWRCRLSPRDKRHRRRSPGISRKRMIYALPLLVVLIAEISAGSTGGPDTPKTIQDDSGSPADSVPSFLSRVTSQFASIVSSSSVETTAWDMSLGAQNTEVGIRGSTDNDVAAVDLLQEQSDEKASLSAVQLANPDVLHRKGSLTIRGSATSAFSKTKPNSIAAQLQTIGEARLAMDQGLNELNLILTGDSDALRSISNTYGIQQQDVAQILEHMNAEIGLAQTFDDLNVMIRNEIQPILADVYRILEDTIPESERRLNGIFEQKSDMGGQTFAPSSSPSGGSSSSPPVRSKDYPKSFPPGSTGFEFLQGNSPNFQNLLNGMLSGTHTAGLFDRSHRMSGFKGSFGRHHHRPKDGSTGRKVHHSNRRLLSQDPPESCEKGCSDIEDDVGRKECNCEDLFYCAKQLKDTDLAVLFSRGLVDTDTGTIEVEEVDLDNERLWNAGQPNGEPLFDENGRLITKSNNALNDLFDADQLLAKRNTIHGLIVQKKCDELLDEFHIPCRDWENGCTGSDGRSYRLTIDEICDAIDSPELITFTSMSEAFDKERSRQDSCDVNDYMPNEDDLLDTAKNDVTNLLDSVSYDLTDENIYLNPGGSSLIDIRQFFSTGVTDSSDVFGSTAGLNVLPLKNFALNKPAVQTKKCLEGQEARNAVNGWGIDRQYDDEYDEYSSTVLYDDEFDEFTYIKDCSCTYPNDHGELYWQVDLEQVRHIAFVKIYNREFGTYDSACGDNCVILRKGFTLTFLDGDGNNVGDIDLNENSERAIDGAGYFYPLPGTYARFVRISRGSGRIDLAEVEVMGWEIQNFRSNLLNLANEKIKNLAASTFVASNINNDFLRNCIAAKEPQAIVDACNLFPTSPVVYALVAGDSFELDVTSPTWDDSSKEFVVKYYYRGRESDKWIVIREGSIPLSGALPPAKIQSEIVGSLGTEIESRAKLELESCYKRECWLDTKVGLQSCQEMIDCAINIWEAGVEAGKSVNNTFPNPFPFAVSGNPTTEQVYQFINSEWNADLALGKTAIASSTHFVLARYVKLTNTGSSYLHLQEVVVMGYDEKGQLKNLALGKSATQSCPYSSDDPYPASLVVDGDISGQASHTCSNQANPWLQIDLGSMYQIESVTIINRDEDCCRDRLKDFYVRFLSDDLVTIVEEIYQGGVIGTSKTYTLTNSDPFFAIDGTSDTYWRSAIGDKKILFSIDLGKVNNLKRIHVDWLEGFSPNLFHFFFSQSPSPPNLEELPNPFSVPQLSDFVSNLARNKTVTQSCQYNFSIDSKPFDYDSDGRDDGKDDGKSNKKDNERSPSMSPSISQSPITDHEDKPGHAWFVVDGSKSSGSDYSRTCAELRPWLTIDLGGVKLIREVKIYNREADVHIQNRLRNFQVLFYDIDPNGGRNPAPVPGGVTTQNDPVADEISFSYEPGIMARYVKIQLSSGFRTFLHLREVEVMGLDSLPDMFYPIRIDNGKFPQDWIDRGYYHVEALNERLVPSRWVHMLFDETSTVANSVYGISDVRVFTEDSTTSKWDSMAWPSQWNLAQDKGGRIAFPNPGGDDALLHRQLGASEISLVETSIQLQGNIDFKHSFNVEKPRECGLDVREDTRCDDARSLLFGKSTSVGQICSIAEAVTTDSDTREPKLVPDNMPGTCCLDNVNTLENFGQRYTCGQTCQRFAPYTLGTSAEACDQVGGTWCRRPCTKLKQCVENNPKRDKCRIAAKYEINNEGTFALTRTGYECDSSGDAVYLYISCKDEKGNNCSLPSQSTVVPSSMPSFSRSPSSSPTVLLSEDPIFGSEAPILGSEEETEAPIIGLEEETRDTTLGPSSLPVTDAPTRGPSSLPATDVPSPVPSSSPVTDAPTRGPNPVSLSNLALNKIATQKCVMMDLTANNAVDGQLNTFSHTGGDYDGCWNAPEGCCTHQAWWSVDLGELKNIQQIKIYNRLVDGGCPQWCQDRLRNFDISLYETNPEGGTPIESVYRVDPIGDEFSFDFGGANARWVRIELRGHDYLHFREVEVLGLDIPPVTDAPNRGLISVEPEPEVPMPGVPPPRQRSLFGYNSTNSDPIQLPEPQININNSVPVLAGSDKMNSTYGQNVPSIIANVTTIDPPSPAPFCQNKTFTFSFTIAFAKSKHATATKKITHFVKARNGIQTDLLSDAGAVSEVSNGNALVVTRNESMTLCSNDATMKNLIILDLENVDYNGAFDVFLADLKIDDASDEAQCQQARSFFGFEQDYIDDYEICREIDDLRCEFDSELYETGSEGGKIPDFQGFEFKQQKFEGFDFEGGNFEGFEFEGDEFEGFEFEGFQPSNDLSFKSVEKIDLEKAAEEDPAYSNGQYKALRMSIVTMKRVLEATGEIVDLLETGKECKIPFMIIAGTGSNLGCTIWNTAFSIAMFVVKVLYYVLQFTMTVSEEIYNENYAPSEEDKKYQSRRVEVIHDNLITLQTEIYSNLNILNNNMYNQHGEVRSTLETQHETMMEVLSSQHSEIGEQLTEQHNKIGTQLTEQHTSIGEQLTEQHNNMGNQMATQHTSIGEQLTKQHNAVGEQLTEQHNRIGKQLTEQHGILQDHLETFAEAFGGTLTGDVGWLPGETPINLLLNINSTIAALAAMANEEQPSRRLGSKFHSSGDTFAMVANAIQALRSDIAIMSQKQADLEAALQLDKTGKSDGQPLRSPSDIAANSEGASGLAVDVHCPPVMPKVSKSTSGMLTIDLLVNTQVHGKACKATVAEATAIYANKDGDYKSQTGILEHSIPLKAKGVQIIRILFDKASGELRNGEDVTTLHIIALKEEQEGSTYQKSVFFDYSDCHQASSKATS